MFGFLKKKNEEEKKVKNNLYAVAEGEVIPIDQVSDPVFSQKMMGDGYAVIPQNGEIYAPVDGKVLSIFPTRHAIGLKMSNGLDLLLHMGVDTVELNGTPFTIKVNEGEEIHKGKLIAEVDLDLLKEAGKSNEIIVIITDMSQVNQYSLHHTGHVSPGDSVGSATRFE